MKIDDIPRYKGDFALCISFKPGLSPSFPAR